MNQEQALLDVTRFSDGAVTRERRHVIGESRCRLFVNQRELVSFMCTPTKLHWLALGFLLSEGIIDSLDQVIRLRVHEDSTHCYWYYPAVGLDGSLSIRSCPGAVGRIDVEVKRALSLVVAPPSAPAGARGASPSMTCRARSPA